VAVEVPCRVKTVTFECLKRSGLNKLDDCPFILAVITARGGSKGIPGKNLVPVGGKPLIAWSIEVALRAPSVSRVIVSTDDEEIAQEARKWGAEVPFMRPRELAGDYSPHIPVVIHATKWMESHTGIRSDYIMLLQPTSPLRSSKDIENAIRIIMEKQGDSVISVCETSAHPYLSKKLTGDGKIKDFIPCPEGYLARQRIPPVYMFNGAIYLVRRDVLMERKTFQTEKTYAYVMPPDRSLDIDTPWDLYLADLIFRDRNAH